MASAEIRRRPDWRIRLIAYLERCARTPFEDGQHDCALFLAGGVEAITGHDYATEFRGAYSTTTGGFKLLRKRGFKDHVDLARHHLPTKPVAFAHEGDGAVVPTDGIDALGIVQGAMIYVLGEHGLGARPLTDATLVLKV